ncbi:hypothetical protein EMMF5_002559 [Cystobasidiomycetes sp. EMM_F5]
MIPSFVCCAAKRLRPRSATPANIFKQAQGGLYGGKVKQYGNNVPESHQKTRRSWLPNIQRAHLYSATLRELIPLKCTTAVLKDVDSAGGLDAYLLHPRYQAVLGRKGAEIREKLLSARAAAQRAAAQRSQAIGQTVRADDIADGQGDLALA